MPRKIFKRWLPTPKRVREAKSLRFLGTLLHDPNLFHLNRHSVSVAFFVGFFIAFQPLPFQVLLAAAGALLLRCNLPISVALVWVSNPVTFPFILYGCYRLGTRILQLPERQLNFEFTLEWFQTGFLSAWQPLLLGGLMAGLFFGCLGYVAIQWLWRWYIVKKWDKRRLKRLARQKKVSH